MGNNYELLILKKLQIWQDLKLSSHIFSVLIYHALVVQISNFYKKWNKWNLVKGPG